MRPSELSAHLDAETLIAERPSDHRSELRLWLRLLTCTTLVENEIRRRLREAFGVTLPRFDLMAQLYKSPDGLSLGVLSRRMMVTNGNITALVERLVADGLVARRASPSDRRTSIVRLTARGDADFERMARAHAQWIADLMGGLGVGDRKKLMQTLAALKSSVRAEIHDDRQQPCADNVQGGR